MKILVDFYAWIEHFRHEGFGHSSVVTCVERGDDLFTPSVVVAEVARKFPWDHLSSTATHRRMEPVAIMSSVVELDRWVVSAAAESDPELRA